MSIVTTASTWLQSGSITLVMSTSNGTCAVPSHDRGAWRDGTALRGSQFHLHFERGYRLPVQSGGSVSSVIIFCRVPRLPFWRITRMSSLVITPGQLISGTWPPWSPSSLLLYNFSSSLIALQWGMSVVIPVWFMAVAAGLLPFRAASTSYRPSLLC